MEIAVTCRACKGRFRVDESLESKQVKCLNCGVILEVPIPFDDQPEDIAALPQIAEEYKPAPRGQSVQPQDDPAWRPGKRPASDRKKLDDSTDQPAAPPMNRVLMFCLAGVVVVFGRVVSKYCPNLLVLVGYGILTLSFLAICFAPRKSSTSRSGKRGTRWALVTYLIGFGMLAAGFGFPNFTSRVYFQGEQERTRKPMAIDLDTPQQRESRTAERSKPVETRRVAPQPLETREVDWSYTVTQTKTPNQPPHGVFPPYVLHNGHSVVSEVFYELPTGQFFVCRGGGLSSARPTTRGTYEQGTVQSLGGKGKIVHVCDASYRRIAMIEGPEASVFSEYSPAVGLTISDDTATALRWAAIIPNRHIALLNETGVFEIQPYRKDNEKAQAWRLEHVGAAVISPDQHYLTVLLNGDTSSAGHIWRIGDTREDALDVTLIGNLPRPSKPAAGMAPTTATVSGNGKLLAAAGGGKLVVWSLDKGSVVCELEGLPQVKRLHFLEKQYLLADGLLVDMRRQAVVWKYELADGILPWETFSGNPDGRLWLVFNHPSKPNTPVVAGMEVPEAKAKQKLDAITPESELPAGSTTITPAMLLPTTR